jgi:outer membrane protein OmpA-like peptidoglycan-associated protein
MKKLIIVCVLTLTSMLGFSQTAKRPQAIGGFVGLTQYNGDLGQGFFGKGQASYAHIGFNYSHYITPNADFISNLSFGSVGYRENLGKGFKANQIAWNAEVRLYLLNTDKNVLSPYAHGGIGFHKLSGKDVVEGTDFCFPFGAGVRYRINELWNVYLSETVLYSDHDNRDFEVRNDNDSYLMHSIGVTKNFGLLKDSDKDGVPDKEDKCPKTPKGTAVDANGCPLDRDGDGILDAVDKCPDVKGTAATQGCPDKDKDGITDADDKCPDVFGVVAMKGCPDQDGDGITDADDLCPTEKGDISMKGCPDKDGDKLADNTDQCPDVAGPIENKGCPYEKDQVAIMEKADNVYFELGKDVIQNNYSDALNQVAELMKKNPNYTLEIAGHTDNTGDAAKNMDLSQRRANTIKKYLETKGIDEKRLTAQGFGDTRPLVPNDSEENKAKNRRVEFKVNR